MARLKRSPKQPTLRPSANLLTSLPDSRRDPSPGLTANLPSNNPFRNRAASPANSLPSPVTTAFNNIPNTAPERPISRNPFLDQSQTDKKDRTTVQVRQTTQERGLHPMAGRSSPKKPALTGHAVELFVSFPPLVRIISKSGDANSLSPRTTLRSTMGLQPTERRRKACLRHTPIVPHARKIILQGLLMDYRDIIHHDHRKMQSIDHMREEDLKGRSRIYLLIHLTEEDLTDVQLDEIRTHRSPAGS